MNLVSFLADDINICTGLAPVWTIFGYIIIAIEIVVPLLLIITGMITMAQAVMAKDEKKVKEAQKTLINKVVSAVICFLVIALTKMIVNLVTKDNNWTSCAKCVFDVNGDGCGIFGDSPRPNIPSGYFKIN